MRSSQQIKPVVQDQQGTWTGTGRPKTSLKDGNLSFIAAPKQRRRMEVPIAPHHTALSLAPDPRLQLHHISAAMEDGQPCPKEQGRGCRASWCTQSLDNNMLISRFSSSPEGISLLKVILLETRHSCSGLGCLLQPSKVCKAICCLILCSLAIYQVSIQRGNRLSCARMADKHQPFCWPTRGPESIIII